MSMTRKEFLLRSGSAMALSALGLSIESCSDDDFPVPDLGGGLTVNMDETPFTEILSRGWVLHPDENVLIANWNDEIRAFTSVCTHEGCARNWIFGRGVFTCRCHSSKFNHRGEVVSGPAEKNLAEFAVERDGNILRIV